MTCVLCRKSCHICKIYALSRGKILSPKVHLWRKNDKYQVWAHLVHPPLLDHLLTEYEIYNMSIICIIQNCMNKLAGDLIKMFKNNSKVGIGGGKVLTGPWIINIYPNVFNVCLTWISRNYCKSNISHQVWPHERSPSIFFRKKDTWRNFSCSVETNAYKNQNGCYRNADFWMKMN